MLSLGLPGIGSITYCIKNFEICTQFFCVFYAKIPCCLGAGGLRHHGEGGLPLLRVRLEVVPKGLSILKNQGVPAPAGDGADLVMVGGADDDDPPSPPLGLTHQGVDSGNVGAGGVDDMGPCLFRAS